MTKYAILAAWILKVMLDQEPNAPWKDTYQSSADVIAQSAIDEPLFVGEDGARKTASEFLSIGWFEGRFNPRAEGDRDCSKRDAAGKCVGAPHSLCMFQVSDGNFGWLHTSRDKIMGDFKECVRAARVMIRQSHTVCRGRAKEDRLGWYARGGEGCAENAKGKHRALKSGWIFAHYPAAEL